MECHHHTTSISYQQQTPLVPLPIPCLHSQKPFPCGSFSKVTRVQHIQMKTWNKTRCGLSNFQRRSIVDVYVTPAVPIQVLGLKALQKQILCNCL